MGIPHVVDELYEKIVLECVRIADGLEGKLLFAANVKVGAVSSAMVYEKGNGEALCFKFGSSLLFDLTYALWEHSVSNSDDSEWRGLELVIAKGEFQFTLFYPDQLPADEDFDDYREEIFVRHFGNRPIDYTNP